MKKDIFMKRKLNRLIVKSAMSILADRNIIGQCPTCGDELMDMDALNVQKYLKLMKY